ncbi:hypothetical protein GCM10023178_30920 [Actinomadura luteofluorescens]
MTSRLLQASLGSPDYDGIRDALRQDTSTEVLAVRGLSVRAAVLPLFKRDEGGALLQAVRLTLSGGGPVEVALKDGAAQLGAAAAGGGTVTLLVPEVDAPRRLTLEVRDSGGLVGAAPLDVAPQRKWNVFVVHHSHLDIGYTDTQGTVLRHHLDYLDAALRLARETDGRPDDARFRWSVESSMPALRWLATRPDDQVAEFAERARAGDIEVTAFPMQLHTEACSTEELYRQLRFVEQLRREHGIEVRSAMHTDIPGAVVGTVDALNAAGVRYLAAAHNWAGRSVPYITGGDRLARPFRWRSPGGGELIVWFTDTPHGMAYMEGNTVGLVDGYDLAEDLLPRYLGSLADRPYPYGPGTFGWYAAPGQVGAAKDPDFLDAVHLRVQGAHADNAGPSIVPADIAHRWNETWAYPRLRMATNADFFEYVEEHHGDRLQTHEGDWTDWWADGLGSGARPLGYVRRAQNVLRAAETLHALADERSGDRTGASAAIDEAYDRAALFDEHTWGAANPWEDAEQGDDSGGLQWTRKSQVGYQAHDDALDLLQAGARRIGATFGAAPDALASFIVADPATATRTDAARAFLPRDVVAVDVPIALVDARTGEPVPHREEEVDPDEWPTRPIGRHLEAVVPDVPGHGHVRVDVVRAEAGAPEPVDLGSGGTIENEFYRVVYDLREGHIASVFDKTAGRELVNADAVAGFGQYVYDRYATAPHFNHMSGHMLVHDKTMLGDRAVATHATVTECSRTPAGERLVVELHGKGVGRTARGRPLPARQAAHRGQGGGLLRVPVRRGRPARRVGADRRRRRHRRPERPGVGGAHAPDPPLGRLRGPRTHRRVGDAGGAARPVRLHPHALRAVPAHAGRGGRHRLLLGAEQHLGHQLPVPAAGRDHVPVRVRVRRGGPRPPARRPHGRRDHRPVRRHPRHRRHARRGIGDLPARGRPGRARHLRGPRPGRRGAGRPAPVARRRTGGDGPARAGRRPRLAERWSGA